jgi:dienelactone hydrolase
MPLAGDPANAVVLIFNHGTDRPQVRHVCNERRDVPAVVREIAEARQWTLYALCSDAIDGDEAGSYTHKRADEILSAVAAYRARGVPAARIFLFGQSAGGWSSLLAARRDHGGFNAVVAFAPAFAGPRHEAARHPWWRGRLAPEQIAHLREAPRIEALIFAFSDDAYDRPEELAPLEAIPGVRIVAFDACNHGHATAFSDCFREGARTEIEHYIEERLAAR